jgi:phosphatidylglycerophosphate synthase
LVTAAAERRAEPRFADQALARLRAARFHPWAWKAFLGDSLRQAARDRAAARGATYEILALAALAGLVIAILAGDPWLAWTAATAAMAVWHVGMLESDDAECTRHLGVANAVTLSRVFLIPLLATPIARFVVVGGLASDAADGAVARRTKRPTRFGRWADSTADAAFVPGAALALSTQNRLAWWATLLVATRFAVGAAIIAVSAFRAARVPPATLIGRWHWPAAATAFGLVAASADIPGGELAIMAGAVGSLADLAVTAPPAWPRGAR